jgi:hypothetical protein
MIAHRISLYYAIMVEYAMSQLDDNQEKNETEAPERKYLRRIIVTLDRITEYNRLTELANLVKNRSKLMSYYGLDLKTGKWNTKQFPVTQSDTQMEGIKSDIKTYCKILALFYSEINEEDLSLFIIDRRQQKKALNIYHDCKFLLLSILLSLLP